MNLQTKAPGACNAEGLEQASIDNLSIANPGADATLAAALGHAAHGWHVFPARIKDGAKCSYIAGKANGGPRWGATTNPDAIRTYWQKFPSALLGIATGPDSGFFVIDADTPEGHGKDGVGTLRRWFTEQGARPQTIEAATPSGGLHLYYRWPDGLNIRNSESKLALGIDVRGEGGMVLAPPTVKPLTGGAYRWQRTPGLFELADCPEWLLDKIRAAQAPKLSERAAHVPSMQIAPGGATAWAAKALQDEIAKVLAAPEGQRNATLNAAAFNLGQIMAGGGLDETNVRASLNTAAEAIGLGRSEIDATIRSGFNAGAAKPRTPVANDPSKVFGGVAPASPLPDGAKTPWPEPDQRLLRAELPAAPELPLRDVLGPRLAQWVANAAESKGAPADYVFAAMLATAGATIGNTRWALVWQGWAEPPVIWAMCVGQPSAGKSPAIDAAIQPLRKAERPLREAAQQRLSEWGEKDEVAKLTEQTWKESARKALKAGDTPPDMPTGCNAGPPPHIPRLVVNDGTIERLGAILALQPRGTLQMRDELAGWLEGMQRYAGGGTDRPFWLEAFGGRGFTVERMGREPLTIDRLSIGVLGGIQPDRLKTLLFKSDDDGLLARFLPIWPDPAPLRRPQAWADESMMEAALAKLLTLDMVEADGETRPLFVPFTDHARDLMDKLRLSVRDWESGAEGLMLSFLGKLPGLAARLALVLAFLDWAAEADEQPTSIGERHFRRAAHLVEAYLLPMAQRAYADAATPKPERAARRLVGIIREQGWQRFTSRDVLRLDRAALGSKAELDPALVLLTEGDCIRPFDQPTNPQGGRPQRIFMVNPALLGGAT